MHRFFIPPEAFQQNEIVFPPEVGSQINRVLRLKSGQKVGVICPETAPGAEFEVELVTLSKDAVRGIIKSSKALATEPGLKITLFLSLTRREKFEWSLQKCTEVGASGFVPIITSRTLIQDRDFSENKLIRWKKIIQEAAEQSGRAFVPTLLPPMDFEKALQTGRERNQLVLFAWEGENEVDLSRVKALDKASQQPLTSLGLFIGPEGGFSQPEVNIARQNDAVTFTLGPRILRMETAALTATALILAYLDPAVTS